jgi:hypothetical protein
MSAWSCEWQDRSGSSAPCTIQDLTPNSSLDRVSLCSQSGVLGWSADPVGGPAVYMREELMLSKRCNLIASTIMLLVLGLQGCIIGITSVDTPEVPSPRPLSLGDVTFDICDPNSTVRKDWTQRIERVLLRDFGIQTRSGTPLGNKPFFHFLVTPEQYSESPLEELSLRLSEFTFSVIPGYYVHDTHLRFQVSAMDAKGRSTIGGIAYQYRVRAFLWAPLIVYPDVVKSIIGGYENRDKYDRPQELLLRKFVMDVAVQLDKVSAQENIRFPLPIRGCPVRTTRDSPSFGGSWDSRGSTHWPD